ncbi:Branched-chain-amino-acid aminotransferase [Mycena sanguinolenta]|uniref:Branched-chain-amino-acid aminotransferase n=1 Tax=Mycena sanguinolenta TaxID=230812 RepID=A0A8H6XFW2_9AGAR|nr:Branched-chain-amino-acid aminotransferase [Mycena sanguinolenta]
MFLHSLRGARLAPARLPLARYIATKHVVPDPMTGELMSSTPDIQVNRLEVTRHPNPATPPPSNTLVFGHTFTDHMLTIPWNAVSGWGTPEIKPYGPLSLEPSATVLHYAQTLFEGMKAYRDEQGKVSLFRPDMNMKRMNSSARRIALPVRALALFISTMKERVADAYAYTRRRSTARHCSISSRSSSASTSTGFPKEPGHSLYVRPTLIGTQKAIGVGPPNEALLFVILSPVGPYYAAGFKPVALYGTTEFIRAAPGGTGAYKLGVNYAPGVVPQKAAGALGYSQNLWLHGPDHELTEVGTMNMFVVFSKEDGSMELVTPPLDGMILPGVTRDSVLTLAREHVSGVKQLPNLSENLVVSERSVNMKEIKAAAAAGRLVEMFGAGTAVVISPVNKIGYMGEDLHIPTGEDGMGPVSRPIWTELVGRQWGTIPSEWSVPVAE